jgi:hypothetical protein
LHSTANLTAEVDHMSSLPCGKLQRYRQTCQARWRRDRALSIIGPVRAHKLGLAGTAPLKPSSAMTKTDEISPGQATKLK